mmetsp:Transcript_4397/g.6552  ORF Transcript_4397/g.6552 Transcript_4397/m.6552 type:complete len:298 (+) Transcript_4397:48-941(+)
MQNRLSDIKSADVVASDQVVVEGTTGDVEMATCVSSDMKLFFEQVEKVKGTIEFIRERTSEVNQLKSKALNAVRTEDINETSEELEKVLNQTNRRCAAAKQLLSNIKTETEAIEQKGGVASELRIRNNMYQTLTNSFVSTVRTYQQAQQDYKDKMKEKVARQVRIVKPEATYEEIDQAMKSGDPGAIYRAAILQPGCDPVQQAYVDVQAKYQDVLRLEESVRALNQMFRDMALLVEKQGEMLDQIEFSVDTAAEHVVQGKEQLKEALVHRKSIRKKYLIIAAIIIVVILVLVLVFVL